MTDMYKILEALSATKALLDQISKNIDNPTNNELRYLHKLATEALALDIWKEMK
jgi:hypothetical protein